MNTLRTILTYERKLYFKDKKSYLIGKLCCTNDYQIWRFIKKLRKAEYYREKSKSSPLFIIPFLYHRCMKNRLGVKLGFDIPEGCFGQGLRIYHISPVVVNPAARIGTDCIIVGDVCIGNVKGQPRAPLVGNNCMFGWGSCAVGAISVADSCWIGAGAVLTKSVEAEGAVLVGVPGKNVQIKTSV